MRTWEEILATIKDQIEKFELLIGRYDSKIALIDKEVDRAMDLYNEKKIPQQVFSDFLKKVQEVKNQLIKDRDICIKELKEAKEDLAGIENEPEEYRD